MYRMKHVFLNTPKLYRSRRAFVFGTTLEQLLPICLPYVINQSRHIPGIGTESSSRNVIYGVNRHKFRSLSFIYYLFFYDAVNVLIMPLLHLKMFLFLDRIFCGPIHWEWCPLRIVNSSFPITNTRPLTHNTYSLWLQVSIDVWRTS